MKCAAAVLALSLLSGPAYAETADIQQMVVVEGTCERLAFGGKDYTATCSTKLLQSIYDNGRVGFYVIYDDDHIVTFSGFDGAKPDADTQLHDIDGVIFGKGDPNDVEAVPASGICSYANPTQGPTTIACQGVTKDDRAFLMVFRSDGSEPKITDFSK
jgi:hypothetical protein